jgi:SAM-dependent methyltransferase
MIYTTEKFLQQFNLQQNISFSDFSNQLTVLNGSDTTGQFVVRASLDDFLAKWAKNDDRLQRLNLYKQKLYQMLVVEPEVALAQWFNKTAALTEDLDFYFDIPHNNIFGSDTFSGKANAKYGRLCKNLNFDKFYTTKKLYDNDFEYTLGLMRAMFENFKLRNSLVGPAFFDHICRIENQDYGQFWIDFMVGCNRASIFNPATYKGIMQEIFTGETVFAPVMGWNAYQLGYYSTDWRHFIATDVIPEVVDNGRWLHTEWQRYKNNSLFEIVDKTVDLYCCPSEQLDQQHGFEAKYKNQVDAVLFSPPYYDLEIYDSADQSFTNYPDYATWLREYWEQTVELCCEVLRPGGKFAFVISNYRNKNKQEVSISQDMQAVVAKHLPLSQQLRVQWSAIAVSRQAKKTRDGNYEDLWIFTK